MDFIELFAGIGGFRYGLETVDREKNGRSQIIEEKENSERYEKSQSINATRRQSCKYNNRDSTRQKSFTCVYVNEWDKYAAKIYEKNFGDRPDTRDIRTVDASEIPDHGLLTGGFPCQAFSIAGKRKGFEDTRGTLFFDIARILYTKKPKYVLLENVKGLLSHDNGNTFRHILWVLDELGYDLQWQVLNSKDFGVPQNRERVFIIGHLRGECRPEIFPIREGNRLSKTCRTEKQIENKFATAVTSNLKRGVHSGGETLISLIRNESQGNRVYDSQGISATLQGLAGGKGAKTGLYQLNDMKIRRLTPIECERLQGFPDNWTEGISDTQRYKCLGNAVTTNVITEIGKRLLRELLK